MLIKPAKGLDIRDPIKHDLIPEEGREVSETDTYWNRQLRTGDVVRVEPQTDQSTSKKKGA